MTPLPTSPKIRPMSEADVVQVVAIEKNAHDPPWSEEHFLSELRNACSYSLVAYDEHRRILGYLVFWMIGTEIHLLNLTIHPEFQRCGIGKELMAFLIQFSNRHGAISIGLEVRRSNRAALGLYHAFGFREKAVRKTYYEVKGEDGILMELELGCLSQ